MLFFGVLDSVKYLQTESIKNFIIILLIIMCIREIVKSDYCLHHACPLGMSQLPLAMYSWNLFGKTAEKIQVSIKSDKNKGTSHEDQYTFLIIFRSVPLRLRCFKQICKINQNTRSIFSNFFFKIRAIDEKMWKNIVVPEISRMILRSLSIACWVTKEWRKTL